MIRKSKIFFNKGESLVEVLVASAIILVVVVGLSATHSLYIKASLGNMNKIQATFLLEEGVEALKTMRDADFTSKIADIPLLTDKYLSFDGSSWQSTDTNTLIDGKFERKFVLAEVVRDNFSDQISSSGTNDPNTRKATIYVSWQINGVTNTLSLATYISNIYDN